MKNVVFFGLFIALISTSCSSDDSNFNQSKLVGTWDYKTQKQYSYVTDIYLSSHTYLPGQLFYNFNANGKGESGGSLLGYTDVFNYELSTWNGKNIIIFKYDDISDDSDTLEVVYFELPNMTLNTKIDESLSEQTGSYYIIDLTKR